MEHICCTHCRHEEKPPILGQIESPYASRRVATSVYPCGCTEEHEYMTRGGVVEYRLIPCAVHV